MIFTRDFVTHENHWKIASLVTQKSLLTVTHALFLISCTRFYSAVLIATLPRTPKTTVDKKLTQNVPFQNALNVIIFNAASILVKYDNIWLNLFCKLKNT